MKRGVWVGKKRKKQLMAEINKAVGEVNQATYKLVQQAVISHQHVEPNPQVAALLEWQGKLETAEAELERLCEGKA